MLFFFFACSDPPQLDGNVTDIFGKPISTVDVFMEGAETPSKTNSDGNFTVSLESVQSGKLRFKVVDAQYMPAFASYDYDIKTFAASPPNPPHVQIQMYPNLSEYGFFTVQDDSYEKLHRGDFDVKKTEIQSYYGIKNIGSSQIHTDHSFVLFYTSIRREEIQQLDLNLNRLEFQDKVPFKTVTGDQMIDIDLWVPSTKQEFTLTALGQTNAYKIEFADAQPGIYAFHTNGLLDESSSHASLPKELQRAYIFEIKAQ